MDKEEYKRKVLEYLKEKHPELEPGLREDFSLDLKGPQGPQVLILETPYTLSGNSNFSYWETELEEFLKKTQSSFSALDLNWEQVKTKVCPQIKAKWQLETFPSPIKESAEKDKVIYTDFIGGLVIGYVIDMPQGFVYLTQKRLADFGVKQEEVSRLAIANLMNLPATIGGPKLVDHGNGIFSYLWESQDGYDAVRVILPDLYLRLSPRLGEEFLVGIPERDFFIAAHPSLAQKLASFILEHYQKSSHPISENLISVTEKGLTTFSPSLQNP